MGIIKKIKNYLYNKFLNKRISQYKYVHLMFNDKFNKPFVDFLNRNFDKNEHIVLCKRWFKEHPFPEGENVIEINNLKGLDFNCNEKLICHSLFDLELVDYLYNHQSILKEKAYWVMWGGDLYNAPRDEKNDFVRNNFFAYCAVANGDEKIAQQSYSNKAKTFITPYVGPISDQMLLNAEKNKHSTINIQLNNSCDAKILEMMNVLSKYKDKNIDIRTILSYGDLKYKDEVIKKGQEIFGTRFSYIDKYLSPEDYCDYMAQNDILVFNQNRQQGIGNALMGLALGLKVFIQSKVTTYEYLTQHGFNIFDTDLINDMSYENFTKYLKEEKEHNIDCGIKFYQNKPIKEWENLFEYEDNKYE